MVKIINNTVDNSIVEFVQTEIQEGGAGPQGPQGPVGPTGATGATGPIGPEGPVNTSDFVLKSETSPQSLSGQLNVPSAINILATQAKLNFKNSSGTSNNLVFEANPLSFIIKDGSNNGIFLGSSANATLLSSTTTVKNTFKIQNTAGGDPTLEFIRGGIPFDSRIVATDTELKIQNVLGSTICSFFTSSSSPGTTTFFGEVVLPLYKVPHVEQKVYSQLSTVNIPFTTTNSFADLLSTPITIPANSLRVGTSICWEIGGDCVEKKNDEVEFQLLGGSGSTQLYATPVLECKEDTTGSQGWKVEIWATVRSIGSSGVLSLLGDWEYTKDAGNKLAGSHFNDANISLNTTANQVLMWKARLSDSSGAGILDWNVTNGVVKICL
jgi:hypothetical protein